MARTMATILTLVLMVGWTAQLSWPRHAFSQETAPSPAPGDAGLIPGLPAEYDSAVVIDHIDGDKFRVEIDGKEHEVNLIGADAPEPDECFFWVSRKFLVNLLPIGSTVYLERDKKDQDDKKRLLRYAWTVNPNNGQAELVNVRVIRYGYAGWVSKNGNTRHDAGMQAAQSKAQDPKDGIWEECGEVHTTAWLLPCLVVPRTTMDAITAGFEEQFKPRIWKAVLARQHDEYPYIVAAMGPVSLMSDNATPDYAVWAVNNLEKPTKIVTADIMAGAFSNFPDGASLEPSLTETTMGVTEALACVGYIEPGA